RADAPALRPLNLIVRVTDRVATLQGPVPTRELARRALQTLRKLPELREVRDRMMVQFEDDPGQLLSAPVAAPKAVPGFPLWADQPPPAPAPEPKKTEVAPAGVWKPVLSAPPGATLGVALRRSTTTQPGLMGAVSRPKDAAGPPAAEPPDGAAISSAVQSLIQAEERYRRLRYEVKQGRVYLSGA